MSTIKDVAIEAEVAVGTVSRYLNGYAIKKQNQIKISNAIKKLNYKVNPIARCLKTAHTNNIAIVTSKLTDSSMIDILEVLHKILLEKGFRCFLYNSCDLKTQKLNECLFTQSIIDAYVILDSNFRNRELIEFANQNNIPVVLIESCQNYSTIDCINTDHYKAVYQAGNILINSGHKKIALFTGYYNLFACDQQINAIKDCYKNKNINIKNLSISIIKSTISVNSFFDSVLENSTAVICGNTYLTKHFIKFCNNKNISIPQNISFIGYDSESFCELLYDKLTIIKKPSKNLGELAAYTILKRINGDYNNSPVNVNLPASIEVGKSFINL